MNSVFLLTWLIVEICVLIIDSLENPSPKLLLMMSHKLSGCFSNLENCHQLAFIQKLYILEEFPKGRLWLHIHFKTCFLSMAHNFSSTGHSGARAKCNRILHFCPDQKLCLTWQEVPGGLMYQDRNDKVNAHPSGATTLGPSKPRPSVSPW